MTMMQRSSSAPQPTAFIGHRRRASDPLASTGLGAPAPLLCTSATLRGNNNRSSCWGSPPPPSASPKVAFVGESPSTVASTAPATATSSEGLHIPQYFAPGTFESNVTHAGAPPLHSPMSQMDVWDLPRPLPLPSPPPHVPDGMPDYIVDSTPLIEPSRSLFPADEAIQRPKTEAHTQEHVLSVQGTVSGTCMVCLESYDDVIGPARLHPYRAMSASPHVVGEEGQKKGEAYPTIVDCVITACQACLKTYFTGIVDAGFDGACPRMRCMCCTRVVCERVWAPLVEPSVLETFQKRAANLLSIQCGRCHTRGTIMVKPPAEHSYSLALDKLLAAVDSATEKEDSGSGRTPPATVSSAATSTHTPTGSTTATPAASTPSTGFASIDAVNHDDKQQAPPSGVQTTRLKKALLVALERYTSGEEIDTSPCYLALEQVFGEPDIGAMSQEVRDDLMLLMMNCVEDSERRASLHVRFIRSNPTVVTRCCKALHCYRCRVIDGHPSQTCEQYEAQRGPEFVCKCPGCGVYVVKGDGCDSITCICGRNFSWSKLVNDRQMMVANAFRDAHPEDTGRAAVQIIRRGLPSAASPAVGDEQGAVGDENQRGHTGGQEPSTAEQVEATQAAREEEQGLGPAAIELERVPQAPIQELVQEQVEEIILVPDEEEQDDRAPFQGTGQGPVTPGGQEEQLGPPVPGGGPLSAEDELRLANAYVVAYPREAADARAAMFGEENPHFTVQRAYAQLDQETWRRRAPALSRYFGRPRHSSVAAVSEAGAEWQAAAAGDWLNHNRAEVELVRRRSELARSALVEAFYGDDTRLAHSTAIAHTAAEHARAALRVFPPLVDNTASRSRPTRNGRQQQRGTHQEDQDREEEPLFRWLGIVEPRPPVVTAAGHAESSASGGDDPEDDEADEEEERWEVPFAEAEIEEDARDIIPAPLTLWTPWPVGRGAPARPAACRRERRPVVADPAARQVSALSAFGTIHLRREVERWVAGSTARQERLRRVMAVEERELSKAWVALWGRRLRLDPSTRTWVDANEDETAAVCTAARRVIFLQAHPEQACAEQRAMMKAFVRRNKAAIASAGEEATAELAAGWERQHAATPASGSSGAASAFDGAHAAYLNHVGTRASQALSAALSACSTNTTPRLSIMTTWGLRRADRMAEAWESTNHRRICAKRFANRFAHSSAMSDQEAEGGNSDHEAGAPTTRNNTTSTVGAVAVVALYVAPMLLGRSSQMCDCDMEGVVSDAADWASFNKESFDKEVERVDVRIAATTMAKGSAGDEQRKGGFVMGRALEGCECGREGLPTPSCSHLVACPVVTRRILKVSEPICSECEYADGLLGGDLFDLFE